MANPRQRRKSRSSSHKAVSHSLHAKKKLRKAPPVRGPKILQDAWDKTKTVRQNYAALGLVASLDPLASGGFEPVENPSPNNDAPQMDVDDQPEAGPSSIKPIPKGYGKIIRDEAGNVVGVEIPEEDGEDGESHKKGKKKETMEDLEPEMDAAVRGKWVDGLGETGATVIGKGAGTKGVVSALQSIAAPSTLTSNTLNIGKSTKVPRHASSLHLQYLERLVEKYGVGEDGIERMSRDRKLNPEQRTVGELKRGLRTAGIVV